MFNIINAHVEFYGHSNTISYITAPMKDQELKTLLKLGRGRMCGSSSSNALKYYLPGSIMVMLWTD